MDPLSWTFVALLLAALYQVLPKTGLAISKWGARVLATCVIVILVGVLVTWLWQNLGSLLTPITFVKEILSRPEVKQVMIYAILLMALLIVVQWAYIKPMT